MDLRRPAEERAEVHGERVDRDVAPGQVGVEARAPEFGEIEVERRRRLQDHPRHPVGLAERDERSPETIRQPASSRRAVSRQDEVDVVDRPLEQEVANRAAHQPDGAADDLDGRFEQRPQRLQRSERDATKLPPMAAPPGAAVLARRRARRPRPPATGRP